MNYENIIFFIGDDDLYEILNNKSKGLTVKSLTTNKLTFKLKQAIFLSNFDLNGIKISNIFNDINNLDNYGFETLLLNKLIIWHNLLLDNKVTIPELVIEEPIIVESVVEELPKKRTRKKKD